jgi:hypothetical protein
MWFSGHITPFWDESYKKLSYRKVPFNDKETRDEWEAQGFTIRDNIGSLVSFGDGYPEWHTRFMKWEGWSDIGLNFFRMDSGDIMPRHSDKFRRYADRFSISDEHSIRRTVVFLEDWKSGHYFEVADQPITRWRAGDFVTWAGETPHMAANLGTDPRFTLQITGVTRGGHEPWF